MDITHFKLMRLALSLAAMVSSQLSLADVITDWNREARNIVVQAKLNTPLANRAMAIVQTSVFDAVNAITQEYPLSKEQQLVDGASDASIAAAVAAANRVALLKLLPNHNQAVEAAYQRSIAIIASSQSKTSGIFIGEKAAQGVLARRLNDGYPLPDTYKPSTIAGAYVPTTTPAAPHWSQRTPWAMISASQFRPGPPPALESETWAKDLNEVKAYGAKNSTLRSIEQTQQALFWQATLPPIYHGVIESVANQPDRSVTQNARFYAAATRATDDAMIAVFDAKYHYGFWRPITAIRNADSDRNENTARDASWTPFIPTPMHPEYPCAHCVVASIIGTIINAEMIGKPMPVLSTSSVTAHGVTRQWHTVESFIAEVSEARIYDGVHYRFSTVAGNNLGLDVGKLAVEKYLAPVTAH